MRRGYSTKAFNDVGVVNVDPEGTAWRIQEEKWKERADLSQNEYFRFAKTLRDLTNTFHENAEYEKEHYNDY